MPPGQTNPRFRWGEPAPAAALFGESPGLRRETGDRHGIAECLEGLAIIARSEQRLLRAVQSLGAAAALRKKTGVVQMEPDFRDDCEGCLAELREAVDAASFTTAWSRGASLPLDEAIDAALACHLGAAT